MSPPCILMAVCEGSSRVDYAGSFQASAARQMQVHNHPLRPLPAGSFSLRNNFPLRDAHVVRRLRRAGALVLGKTNMGEFAFFPSFTTGSLFGVVRNPYHLGHTPAGAPPSCPVCTCELQLELIMLMKSTSWAPRFART